MHGVFEYSYITVFGKLQLLNPSNPVKVRGNTPCPQEAMVIGHLSTNGMNISIRHYTVHHNVTPYTPTNATSPNHASTTKQSKFQPLSKIDPSPHLHHVEEDIQLDDRLSLDEVVEHGGVHVTQGNRTQYNQCDLSIRRGGLEL